MQEALRALPGWQLAAGGRAIDRLRQFPDAPAAAAILTRRLEDFQYGRSTGNDA